MKTYKEIEQMFKEKGYKFFKGDLNINLFSIRKKINTNLFDDLFCIAYEKNGVQYVKEFPVTTDAGLYWLLNPMQVKGTAIIVPGQYLGAYEIGLHRDYEALRQKKSMKYYRDANRDNLHDVTGKIEEGIYYTNIHHAGLDSTNVDKWSAGCIVFKKLYDFKTTMGIVKESAKKYGNSFTFTLFSEV
jgi:hypothetical protein